LVAAPSIFFKEGFRRRLSCTCGGSIQTQHTARLRCALLQCQVFVRQTAVCLCAPNCTSTSQTAPDRPAPDRQLIM
jgi:hypothetical protein